MYISSIISQFHYVFQVLFSTVYYFLLYPQFRRDIDMFDELLVMLFSSHCLMPHLSYLEATKDRLIVYGKEYMLTYLHVCRVL